MKGQGKTAMTPNHDNRPNGTDLNPGSPEYITGKTHSTETFGKFITKMVTHFNYLANIVYRYRIRSVDRLVA
jgi:hypothetical protein